MTDPKQKWLPNLSFLTVHALPTASPTSDSPSSDVDAILDKIKSVNWDSYVELERNVLLQDQVFMTVNETLEAIDEADSYAGNPMSVIARMKIGFARAAVLRLEELDIPAYYRSLARKDSELRSINKIRNDFVSLFKQLEAALKKLVEHYVSNPDSNSAGGLVRQRSQSSNTEDDDRSRKQRIEMSLS